MKENVCVLISTCGEGALPQNARGMFEELGRAEPGVLENVNHCVFALGDKAYRHFCSAGEDFDKLFTELGSKRLMPMGIGDDKDEDKYETGFAEWLPQYWTTVDAPPDPTENDPPKALFDLAPATEQDILPIAGPPRTQKLKMNFNKRTTSPDYPFSIRHIQFDAPDLPYLLGDALAVNWSNCPDEVDAFLKQYGIDGNQCMTAVPKPGVDGGRKAEQLEAPFRLKDVFVDLLDIFGRPTKNLLKDLSKLAPEVSADQKRLKHLVSDEGKEAFTKEIAGEYLKVSEILLMFPSCKPDLGQLLTMIPVMKPRLYTIASSTRDTPGKIDLTVITDEWKAASGGDRVGRCTDFFERTCDSKGLQHEMYCNISPGSFEFGEPDVPMVMTGTGTGIAPFLAFAKERDWWVKRNGIDALKDERNGNMWLFYGCRNEAEDYILKDDLLALEAKGVLSHLRPAFSRDGPQMVSGEMRPKAYVQDRIVEAGDGVYDALVTRKGYLYLCGQAGDREADVLRAVRAAFAVGGKLSTEEAQKKLDELIEDGRYCPELY